MQAVTFASAGAEAQVTEIPVPNPGPGQVLVKTLWAAINPIDTFSATTGMLVVGWPFVRPLSTIIQRYILCSFIDPSCCLIGAIPFLTDPSSMLCDFSRMTVSKIARISFLQSLL